MKPNTICKYCIIIPYSLSAYVHYKYLNIEKIFLLFTSLHKIICSGRVCYTENWLYGENVSFNCACSLQFNSLTDRFDECRKKIAAPPPLVYYTSSINGHFYIQDKLPTIYIYHLQTLVQPGMQVTLHCVNHFLLYNSFFHLWCQPIPPEAFCPQICVNTSSSLDHRPTTYLA